MKSETALDGFVGPAMNIMHDTEDRDVSRRGEELSAKLRKSARYLERGQRNQEAYNGALSQSLTLLDQAIAQTLVEDRKELEKARTQLAVLAGNPVVESSLDDMQQRFEQEGQRRLTEVQADSEQTNVSHHGRPLWDLFETSMVGLSGSRERVEAETESLDSVIVQLRASSS